MYHFLLVQKNFFLIYSRPKFTSLIQISLLLSFCLQSLAFISIIKQCLLNLRRIILVELWDHLPLYLPYIFCTKKISFLTETKSISLVQISLLSSFCLQSLVLTSTINPYFVKFEKLCNNTC